MILNGIEFVVINTNFTITICFTAPKLSLQMSTCPNWKPEIKIVKIVKTVKIVKIVKNVKIVKIVKNVKIVKCFNSEIILRF